MPIISIIAAVEASTRIIGANNDLPWGRNMPSDLAHFYQTTLDKLIITGRRTYLSIPEKNGCRLAGRRKIVLTKRSIRIPRADEAIGTDVAPSLEHALGLAAKESDEVFIIGGASVFKEALANQNVSRMYLTHVFMEDEIESSGNEIFFPRYDADEWKCVSNDGRSRKTVSDKYESQRFIYERTA